MALEAAATDQDRSYLDLVGEGSSSYTEILLFDHPFEGDFPRSGMRWRSAPFGSACHLISLHVHFNVERAFTIGALGNVKS